MNTYDFLNLSAIEFEELSRDLLQKYLDCFLESFTEGRDNGIDLRGSLNDHGTLLVQCKRYKDYKLLKGNLTKELQKVNQIHPNRYIVVTSASLTPNNKEEIQKLFHPYILNSSDIFGKNDLNNLISLYKDIEEKYYKLWLSSTKILNKILHGNIVNRSEFLVENITKDIKMFVQNESFNDAINILNDRNFIIISGNPGVGKTTLAKMLVYEYLANDFEVIEISEDIEEANRLFIKGKKQVFYYDDFLGSNFLEKTIKKNEDKRLYGFIERVRNSKNHKLIMTTREYILNQAKQKYELFVRADFNLGKHILDLVKYTVLSKAEILYNHLFFSDLEGEYISSILKDSGYNKIINHPNYNPRVIELMTIKLNKTIVAPENYTDTIIKTLENPTQIWLHAFENQISVLSKYILYTLLISNNPITEQAMLRIIKNMIKFESKYYNYPFQRESFLHSLKELENTFIKITKRYDGENLIQFQNPSVKDFLLNYIEGDEELLELIIESLVYFNHLFTIFDVFDKDNERNNLFTPSIKLSSKKIRLSSNLRRKFINKLINSFHELDYFEHISTDEISEITKNKILYLHSYYDYSNTDINHIIACSVSSIEIENCIADEKETLVDIIFKTKDIINIDAYQFIDSYIDNICSLSDVRGLMNLSELFEDDFNVYYAKFENYLRKSIDDAIEDDIEEAIKDEDQIVQLIDELILVNEYFDGAVSTNIRYLQERLQAMSNYQDEMDSEDLRGYRGQKNNDDAIINIKISNMFSSLRQ
ncbi:nSTAND3 domain-containing NTPase [Paenibacillus bouchesdurhonensis]|uniref:nSTAND3 domain-containing NTPase n=1 Tax=Paenibacillus bouchesdurhonensis TaxID=1870990 RepID=UPI0019003200|nr:restriction endonuclease [Paenibacillus bouchesdurhonensis]